MRLPPKGPPPYPNWQFFSVERASRTVTAAAWLVDNFVSASLPTPATHKDLVRFICASAQRPIPVIFISDALSSVPLIRGQVCFAMPGKLLDEVARAHEDMGWWVTDEGLHMEAVPPTSMIGELDLFSRIAGGLAIECWDETSPRRNTRLSAEDLRLIGKCLDEEQIALVDVLQPKERATLKAHNQRAGKLAIKSFQALADSRQSRMLRKHLSAARARYLSALATEGRPLPIPRIFWSVNPILY